MHDPDREYDSLEAMAAHYAALIQAHQPEGPYHLLGWSMGGLLAMAVARQLEDEKQPVAFVGLLDTHLPSHDAFSWEQDPLLGLVLACGSNIAGMVAGLDLQTGRLCARHSSPSPQTNVSDGSWPGVQSII